jgi:hypothetical protein
VPNSNASTRLRLTARAARWLRGFQLACVWLTFSCCAEQADADGQTSGEQARLAFLALAVQQLDEQSARLSERLALHFQLAPAEFSLTCPAPWRDVEPIGAGLWACRTPQALKDGFWPNCNLTKSEVSVGLDPKHYFETALSGSPQLRAAARGSQRTLSLHGLPAYQAVYTHRLSAMPLQVLATVLLRDTHVYALTCTAAPAEFASVEPVFRRIADSLRVLR